MKYAICTITTDNYIHFTETMIKSFIKNNKWFCGDIVILYDDINVNLNVNSQNKLSRLYKNIKFKKCVNEIYNTIVNNNYFALLHKQYKTCVLKYELFRMNEYDKLLYVDSDTIINRSLEFLFMQNYPLAVVGDWNSSKNISKNDTNQFFNAGVLFFGNHTFINDNVYNDVISYTLTHKPEQMFEQQILNDWLKTQTVGDYYFLPYKYNFAIHKGNEKNASTINDSLLHNAYIIHYWYKPYDIPNDCIANLIYKQYEI